MKNALSFVPTINLRRLRIPFLSLTLFPHCYPSQTLLCLKFIKKRFSTHMHNWLLLYICRKNTYQSAVIRSISQCLAPKFASLSQPQKPEAALLSSFEAKLPQRDSNPGPPGRQSNARTHSATALTVHHNPPNLIIGTSWEQTLKMNKCLYLLMFFAPTMTPELPVHQ